MCNNTWNGQVTYQNMIMGLFESLGVEMETSDMSFSVSLDNGKGHEYGSRNGFSSLFAQKKNILNPRFYRMIREIANFKDDAIAYFLYKHHESPESWIVVFFCCVSSLMKCSFNGRYLEVVENYNPDLDRIETLGEFVKSRGYSEFFQKAYLVRQLEHRYRIQFSPFGPSKTIYQAVNI